MSEAVLLMVVEMRVAVAMVLPNQRAGMVDPSTVRVLWSKVTVAPASRVMEEKITTPPNRPAVTSQFVQIPVWGPSMNMAGEREAWPITLVMLHRPRA